MNNNHEYITLVMQPLTIMVEGGKHGREYWQAPGLTVCVKGPLPVKRYAAAANIAMNEALARHIPARALKRICGCAEKIVKVDPKQKDMFK